jgi:hypothetical protein
VSAVTLMVISAKRHISLNDDIRIMRLHMEWKLEQGNKDSKALLKEETAQNVPPISIHSLARVVLVVVPVRV